MLGPFLALLIAQAAPASPSADAAVIRNSGSTNTSGYTIVVHPDFSAEVTQNGMTKGAAVAAPQAKWLFARLREAQQPGALPARGCMKSASFGSSTTIEYGGATTPDIGCAANPLARELGRTVSVIVAQLGIVTLRHPMHLAEPSATP